MTDTMKAAGHTLGEWYADGRDVRGPGSWTIAQAFHTPDGNVFRNARLIAAAPALLAVAVALDADWTREFPDGPDTKLAFGRLADETVALWKQCRAAIRLATLAGAPK